MTDSHNNDRPLPCWSKSTLLEYERFSRSYRSAAQAASQLEATPDPQWFANHVASRCEKNGKYATRRYARYVECFFQSKNTLNLVQTPRIQAILRAPDDFDVASVDLEPISEPLTFRRAQMYADQSYTADYARNLRRQIKHWTKFCDQYNVVPTAPSLEDVLGWLGAIGKSKSPSLVKTARNALAYLLHREGVIDNVTRSPQVDQLIDGVKRSYNSTPVVPYSPQERRAILHTMQRTGIGLRDRTAVLLTAFTPWSADTIVMLDVEDCRIDDLGAHISSPVDGHVLHVGRHEVEDLDLASWLGRLSDAVSSGPLFRRVHVRSLCFSPERMSSQALLASMRRAASEAGVSGAKVTERLRALFDLEKRDIACETVIAKHEGRKYPRKSHQSQERRELVLMLRKHRGRSRSL